MKSALYQGKVSHTRLLPKKHHFSYDVYMLFVNLDEVDELVSSSRLISFRWAPLQFKRSDFHGDPECAVKAEVYKTVENKTGLKLDGPVVALANWRCFGFNFNPVIFYYCFAADGKTLRAIVAEVTNTPWFERHAYVLLPEQEYNNESLRVSIKFEKQFTVSPFNPVNMDYDWESSYPGEKLFVRIKNFGGSSLIFHAALHMKKLELNRKNLRKVLLRFPVMSISVVASIYFQALKLIVKGVPYLGKDKLIEDTVQQGKW